MPSADHIAPWRRMFKALLAAGRAAEWWEFKLLPAIAIGYLTCLQVGSNAWAGLGGLGWLILALVPGGICVSVVNDLTDRADDALAGKDNRLTGLNPLFAYTAIGACLTVGASLAWMWRADPLLVATYAAGWISFALYSVRPFRFKNRGAAGLLCDATGANMVPALLAAQLCARALELSLSAQWLAAIAVWSLMFGLRGILWHQIGDLEADQRSNTLTFVALHGVKSSIGLGKWMVFPVELAAIAAIAWQAETSAQVAGGIALLGYAILIHERYDRFRMSIILVEPKPRSCILLHDYYDVFLPLALVIAGVANEPWVLAVLLLHLTLFPNRAKQVWQDSAKLLDPQYTRRPSKRGTGR